MPEEASMLSLPHYDLPSTPNISIIFSDQMLCPAYLLLTNLTVTAENQEVLIPASYQWDGM